MKARRDLTNLFFIGTDTRDTKNVQQGFINTNLGDGYYRTTTFSWVDGAPIGDMVFHLDDMRVGNWKLFGEQKDWRAAGERVWKTT